MVVCNGLAQYGGDWRTPCWIRVSGRISWCVYQHKGKIWSIHACLGCTTWCIQCKLLTTILISARLRQVDSLGEILDLRNKETCPSLKNVSKWSSAKIKEHCVKAFEAQMKELEEVEGPEVKLMRTLKAEFRVVRCIISESM